jgi:hypothetical protein
MRGSAHACAGTALCDDGLVVDESRTKEVRVFRGFKGTEAAAALHAVALCQPGPQLALKWRVVPPAVGLLTEAVLKHARVLPNRRP